MPLNNLNSLLQVDTLNKLSHAVDEFKAPSLDAKMMNRIKKNDEKAVDLIQPSQQTNENSNRSHSKTNLLLPNDVERLVSQRNREKLREKSKESSKKKLAEKMDQINMVPTPLVMLSPINLPNQSTAIQTVLPMKNKASLIKQMNNDVLSNSIFDQSSFSDYNNFFKIKMSYSIGNKKFDQSQSNLIADDRSYSNESENANLNKALANMQNDINQNEIKNRLNDVAQIAEKSELNAQPPFLEQVRTMQPDHIDNKNTPSKNPNSGLNQNALQNLPKTVIPVDQLASKNETKLTYYFNEGRSGDKVDLNISKERIISYASNEFTSKALASVAPPQTLPPISIHMSNSGMEQNGFSQHHGQNQQQSENENNVVVADEKEEEQHKKHRQQINQDDEVDVI